MDEHRRRNLWSKKTCHVLNTLYLTVHFCVNNSKKLYAILRTHTQNDWQVRIIASLISLSKQTLYSSIWYYPLAFRVGASVTAAVTFTDYYQMHPTEKTDTSNFSNTSLTLIEIVMAMTDSIPSFQCYDKWSIHLMIIRHNKFPIFFWNSSLGERKAHFIDINWQKLRIEFCVLIKTNRYSEYSRWVLRLSRSCHTVLLTPLPTLQDCSICLIWMNNGAQFTANNCIML